ncbi:MAG: NAD-dependent epimerase/dehydratase family protein [Pseudomonadota bacterium]
MVDRVLITGGNGNLGRLVAARLSADGARVTRFDLPGTTRERERAVDVGAERDAPERIVVGDVTDATILSAVFEAGRFDAVCHLASLLSGSSEQDRLRAWEINATASLSLMDLAVAHNCRRFFFASTFATYGAVPRGAVSLDAQQWPENLYGVTKIAVERLGAYFAARHGLDFRCARFPMVLSPFAPAGAATAYPSHAFRAAAAGKPFVFPVSRDAGVSTMHLDDVVEAIVRLLHVDGERLREPVYNLHAFFVSAGEIADLIARRVPGFSPQFKPQADVQALIEGWPDALNDGAARADWGWAPCDDLDVIADRMMAQIASNDAR